ncbi:hypothetical protein P3S67_015991 [Capsicum chacoense]
MHTLAVSVLVPTTVFFSFICFLMHKQCRLNHHSFIMQIKVGTFRHCHQQGLSGGAIGISIRAIRVVLLLAGLVYVGCYRNKAHLHQSGHGPASSTTVKAAGFDGLADGNSPGLSGITVDKYVEFTYEELATSTNDFSIANKIGQGGSGAVYYAELRGKKAAIKKMDMEAMREFLAELKVLTNVHHLNLVRLIGYCVEGSLFLVYEYVENGHIGQHLRGTGRDPLPWSKRVQIALDSASGLEYIHEHTVPVYIHRDIKTANILIDKNFHAKICQGTLFVFVYWGRLFCYRVNHLI